MKHCEKVEGWSPMLRRWAKRKDVFWAHMYFAPGGVMRAIELPLRDTLQEETKAEWS